MAIPPVKVRKSFSRLSQAERLRFIKAVLQLKEDPPTGSPRKYSYSHFVAWHRIGIPLMGSGGRIPAFADFDKVQWHGNVTFLSWHRAMLLLFEENLRLADEEINLTPDDKLALPYWDWTFLRSKNPKRRRGMLWRDEYFGPNGDLADDSKIKSSVFGANGYTPSGIPGWEFGDLDTFIPSSYNLNDHFELNAWVKRAISNILLPDRQRVRLALRIDEVDAPPGSASDIDNTINPSTGETVPNLKFRNVLEGKEEVPGIPEPWLGALMHDRVHVWVGGSMGDVFVSPKDPLFFLHHCNVDRLWAQWQLRTRTKGQSNPVTLVRSKQYLSDAKIDECVTPPTSANYDPNPFAIYSSAGLYPWDGTGLDYHNGEAAITETITTDDVLNWTEIYLPSVSSTPNIGYRYSGDPLSVKIG